MSEISIPKIVPLINDADAKETPASRRTFMAAGATAGFAYVAALGYPVYRYLASPVEQLAAVAEVTLKDAHKLAAGTAMMFKFGSSPAMLIHHRDDTWVALGAVCTHLGCTVQYQPDRNKIHCACHSGEYDPTTGANIAGPRPRLCGGSTSSCSLTRSWSRGSRRKS